MGSRWADGGNGETRLARKENMDDECENETKPRFASHWLTIQPRLFPEWEREMERRDLEELEKREAEAAAAREAKRVSRASRRKPAPPR